MRFIQLNFWDNKAPFVLQMVRLSPNINFQQLPIHYVLPVISGHLKVTNIFPVFHCRSRGIVALREKQSPKTALFFPMTVLSPHSPPVLPPKGVHCRTFSSINCRLFALNQERKAYFRILCRNFPFCATCCDPKCRFLPKDA